MKLRAVIIDEPIHVYNQQAVRLWQKTIWAKELGYRSNYKSSFLPLGVDDFFGTHLIVAEEDSNGELEPIVMYKSVRKSQADRFKTPFGLLSMLNSTPHKDSKIVHDILMQNGDVSYDSSWTINPKYKKDKDFSLLLRDFVTMFCFNHHKLAGFSRWFTGGAKQFKVDNYFEWLGGRQVLPEFTLENFDNQAIRLFYVEDTNKIPPDVQIVLQRMESYWNNLMIFAPQNAHSKLAKAA